MRSALCQERDEGQRVLQGRRNCALVVTSVSIFATLLSPNFLPVPGRQLLRRYLDHVVCPAGYAAGHSSDHQVLPAYFTASWTLIPLTTIWSCASTASSCACWALLCSSSDQVGRMSIIMYRALHGAVLSDGHQREHPDHHHGHHRHHLTPTPAA